MTDDQAILTLAAQIGNLADAINHLAVASQAARTPPGAAKPPATGNPDFPPRPTAPVATQAEKTIQQKRGGLIFYACRDNGFPNRAAEVGKNVLGRDVDKDSRNWADADQVAVLEAMKTWGWIEEK